VNHQKSLAVFPIIGAVLFPPSVLGKEADTPEIKKFPALFSMTA
jgi:hypothetical protein